MYQYSEIVSESCPGIFGEFEVFENGDVRFLDAFRVSLAFSIAYLSPDSLLHASLSYSCRMAILILQFSKAKAPSKRIRLK